MPDDWWRRGEETYVVGDGSAAVVALLLVMKWRVSKMVTPVFWRGEVSGAMSFY